MKAIASMRSSTYGFRATASLITLSVVDDTLVPLVVFVALVPLVPLTVRPVLVGSPADDDVPVAVAVAVVDFTVVAPEEAPVVDGGGLEDATVDDVEGLGAVDEVDDC